MAIEEKILFVSYVYSEKLSLFLIRSIFTSKSSIQFDELDLDERLEITSDGYISGFFDEDELTKFAYELSDKLKQSKVCLISPDCFNRSLETTNKVSNLMDAFYENGSLLENPDRNRKGFFSNLIR